MPYIWSSGASPRIDNHLFYVTPTDTGDAVQTAGLKEIRGPWTSVDRLSQVSPVRSHGWPGRTVDP